MKIRGVDVQPVIIVGHGRSGTIHLAEMLHLHPDVYATIEQPRPLFRLLNESLFNPTERHAIPNIFEAKKQWLRHNKTWMGKTKPRVWVEKSNAMVLVQDLVEKTWPEAYILHIIRNPFDVYCSSLTHPGLMSWLKRASEVMGLGDNSFLGTTAKMNPWYENAPTPVKLAYKWKSWVEHGLKWQRESDKVLTLTYRDMTRRTAKTFNTIQNFIGLEKNQAWLEDITGRTHSKSVDRYKTDMPLSKRVLMNAVLYGFLESHDVLKKFRLR